MPKQDLGSVAAKTIFIFAFSLLLGTAQLFLFTWNIDKKDIDIIAVFCYISGCLIGLGLWFILLKKYLPTYNFYDGEARCATSPIKTP